MKKFINLVIDKGLIVSLIIISLAIYNIGFMIFNMTIIPLVVCLTLGIILYIGWHSFVHSLLKDKFKIEVNDIPETLEKCQELLITKINN